MNRLIHQLYYDGKIKEEYQGRQVRGTGDLL